MKKQIKIWGTRSLSLVLLVVAMQHWGMPLYKQYFQPKKTVAYVPTTTVREGKFTVSFHEIGTLEAENSVPVNSEIEGKIITLVDDGTVVGAGSQIVVLDTESLQREVMSKKLGYENTIADVNRAKAELEILKESNRTEVEQSEAQLGFEQTELDRAKKALERETRLAEDKLVPKSEVEKAEFDVRSNELSVLKDTKALTLKKKEVQSKEEQKVADVRNVEFRASMAKMELDRCQGQLSMGVVTAPTTGLVVISKTWSADGRRKLQEGDQVHPQQMICSLPDLSSMQVKINVGEADAPKVKIGVPVLIKLEAVPKKVFHGTVDDVSTLATEPSPWESGSTPGRKNFEVTVAVKEVDSKTLKPGMTADVEFLCEQIKKSVYVPLEAVQERNSKTFVFVKNGQKYSQVAVKTGKKNDNFICITKGLKKGHVITLRDPSRPTEDGTSDSNDGQEDKKADKPALPMPKSAGKK